ncbi:MAG: cupredoxin domain-containing protein [Chloroflexi bacterium]|nr:cupredoxin domain-containing protein [Chloroflexota bacterium]
MAPASMAPGSMVPADSTITVGLADFTVTPMVIDAVGPTVTFDVSNAGPTPHNLTIRDAAGTVLGATANLSTGDTAVLTVTFPGPGPYITFCSLPGHESLGLKGELVVTEAAPMVSPAASPAVSPAS